ncbi:hypothetical protein Vadar_004568 [Vaccinium darrowii]|uniref:Uncharacterized protein n=1 Tax=Vaccinium darrowii TaxID=229202 RepID=A0ACB7WXL3_9ERIC|nr:hypothetical protein Vadar_004568 [Vaccinium darrowii]
MDTEVQREVVVVGGREAVWDENRVGDGVVWFRSGVEELNIGFSLLIVDRMDIIVFVFITLAPSSSLIPPSFQIAMEDWNTIVSDCIVISCCCQCLIVEIVIFIFLKLPYKMVQKTKRYAKKKLRQRKRGKTVIEMQMDAYRGEYFFEFNDEGLGWDEFLGCGGCMEEVDKVIGELFQKGEFAFGSFWREGEPGNLPVTISR